ncbi:MAG TPA: type II toxin-antitoxin system VapC family toxin [Candidatus Nanopelagicales bacterium]|nr:type II toxin-antitoxin system VapC family toxin [Candidatus Nanopelagicales bacterium]
MSTQGGVVLDASAAVTWVLRDAKPEDEERIDELVSTAFVLVPELWHAEMANAIRSAIRAGRIDEGFVVGVCEQLDQLDIRTDVVGTQVQRLTLEAHAHDLTAYDTTYLVLAKDRGLPLATLDRQLARAAVASGVRLAL